MKRAAGFGMAAIFCISALPLLAARPGTHHRNKPLPCLAGRIDDYTHNHGQDNRLYSAALNELRDLYVYLPPGYDPAKRYPVILYFHGILQDERGFIEFAAPTLDQAMLCGLIPPAIIAIPDGSIVEDGGRSSPGSFFLNNKIGRYQDWVLGEVMDFVEKHYPVRPEREAHILTGVSMGGFGAYNIALKHRDRFKIVVGVLPVLNLRYLGACGKYMTPFDPLTWTYRTDTDDPNEVIGRFAGGLVKIRIKDLIYPVFGTGPEGVARASEENPIELVERTNLQDGELDMFIAYAGRDNFNLNAQAESFLYVLEQRGIKAFVHYDPKGTHSEDTAVKMVPTLLCWLGERMRANGLAEPVPTVTAPTPALPPAAGTR